MITTKITETIITTMIIIVITIVNNLLEKYLMDADEICS
jgi:hypothetical protein